jgi:peptidyl-prolyl cis-trans isomerase A (cyclophilin A)
MTALAGLTLSGAALAAQPRPTPQVELKTTMGDIVLELNREKAPKSVDNFLNYVWLLQRHDFPPRHRRLHDPGRRLRRETQAKTANKPVPIESQNGLSNVKYSLAMARTADPNSATSQFFINVEDNAALDYPGRDGCGYTVFGKV